MFVRALCFALLCFERKDSEVVVENLEGEGRRKMMFLDFMAREKPSVYLPTCAELFTFLCAGVFFLSLFSSSRFVVSVCVYSMP